MSAVMPSRRPAEGLGLHPWAAVVLMLIALAIAAWARPTAYWADVTGKPDIQHIFPEAFGDWMLNPYGANVVVNPQQEEALQTIYDATLARAYIHKPSGRQIMLSVAYGRDQSHDTQLHPPEACYRSQGFRVDRLAEEDLQAGTLTLPVTRMDSVMGTRHEYVTYWMRVGEHVTRGSRDRNLTRMRFASKGYIVDGLLFRVSEVTRNQPGDTFAFQDGFVRDLLANMSPRGREDVLGSGTLANVR